MIFEDQSGRRRRWAIGASLLASLLIAVPLVVYFLGVRVAPHFPEAQAPSAKQPALPSGTAKTAVDPRLRSSFVFAANDDPPGARAINEHLDAIEVIVPDWFRVPGAGCKIEETVDSASRAWTARSEVKVVARLANLSGDSWTKKDSGALLHDPQARACIARTAATRAHALGAKGINVDFESLSANDAEGLIAFMTELRNALGNDAVLSIDVTADDPAYDLPRLAKIADAIILMAYDEHEETSAPGPIASAAWFGAVVDRTLKSVPPERLVVGIGSYCYDWTRNVTPAFVEPLGFSAAMDRAASAKALPTFERSSGGTTFAYEAQSKKHEVWCADATAVQNQLVALRARGLDRWALWRAGTEDPSLWALATAKSPSEITAALATSPATDAVATTGSGDGWKMMAPPTDGKRDVTFAADGAVERASYRVVPTGRLFRRLGGNERREVVLTFDDGPDATFTPVILDTLHALDAPATFFVLGEQAMAHPELIRRIGSDGHLVGNHTFHHPHIDKISVADLMHELRSTERVLEGQLGRYTPVFRAPYTAAFDANAPELLATHLPAFEAGYIVVGGDVDPADWATPGASVIADRMISGIESGGRIVVLHDAGGDRTQTAEALRIALPRLRANGYAIVPLDRHLGLERAQVAAPIDSRDAAIAKSAQAATILSSNGPSILGVLFSVCTLLAGARVVLLVFLALKRKLSAKKEKLELANEPLVTILVPAYNEEKVLKDSVRSLLKSDYRALEVLIIDDGSTDGTFAVGEALAKKDARVRCLRKTNGGKAAASNFGIQHARGEIIVGVDADTVISPDAVRMLVQHFADPNVSAVCGNVEVGNVHSILTMFQAIEYVTSQNLDRAALAELNAVTVVPGALGAWRRDVLLAVGGYAHDTLVEDADLTLSVLRAGGRIQYEAKAIARTEAPETLRALWKQRFRWTYGTYQCLAKHRRALLRGPVGLIALPNMILFQVVFPLLSPIGDGVMLLALLSGQWSSILSGYVGFLAMDFLASAIAFKLDKKPLRWLPLLLIQRFTYRQFMYFVCLRAFLAAIVGGRYGWRKLERTGTVAIVQGLPAASLAPPPLASLAPAPIVSIIPPLRTEKKLAA